MSTVRARFTCTERGEQDSDQGPLITVRLQPKQTAAPENEAVWAKGKAAGDLIITRAKSAVGDFFVAGADYLIDITPAG